MQVNSRKRVEKSQVVEFPQCHNAVAEPGLESCAQLTRKEREQIAFVVTPSLPTVHRLPGASASTLVQRQRC